MAIKFRNTDIIDQHGIKPLNVDAMTRNPPTDYTYQNWIGNPRTTSNDNFGDELVLKDGWLFVGCSADDTPHADVGIIWGWRLSELALTGGNSVYTNDYKDYFQPNALISGGGGTNIKSFGAKRTWDAGYNSIAATVRDTGLGLSTSQDRVWGTEFFQYEGSLDNYDLSSEHSFGIGFTSTDIEAVTIGNGRIYYGYFNNSTLKWAVSIHSLPSTSSQSTQITEIGPFSGASGTDNPRAMAANHGLVVVVNGSNVNGWAKVYTANGRQMYTLFDSDSIDTRDSSVAIGDGRIVIGLPRETGNGEVRIYDYTGRPVKFIDGDDQSQQGTALFGWDVAVGNGIIAVGVPYGEADRSPYTTPSDAGYVLILDLDGNVATDYGQDGIFWNFQYPIGSDYYGTSVSIGNDMMVVGAPGSSREKGATVGTGGSGSAGAVMLYKLPQTLGSWYDQIIQTYRYI